MKEQPPASPRMERVITGEEAERRMIERVEASLKKGKPPAYTSFALLLNAQNQPLLFERRTAPYAGLYSVVGGKIDYGLGAPRTDSSRMFEEAGFEPPTDALMRELTEEVYRPYLGLLQHRPDWLELQVAPERKAFVYDADFNAINALYIAHANPNLEIEVSERELGAMKTLAELKPEQLNPMTHFFLNRLGFVENLPPGVTWGALPALLTPHDVLTAEIQSGEKKYQPTYRASVPMYYIETERPAEQ